jgi:pyocin large subunit-like protein
MATRSTRTPPKQPAGKLISNRQIKRLLPLVVTAILAIVTYSQQQSNRTQSRTQQPTAAETPVRSNTGTVEVNRDIGFRTKQRFDDHFVKHGREFGNITKAKYLLMAQELRDAPLSTSIIEARQARGNLARFDRSSGGFIAFDDRLIIQTFFRPNDGEAYFRRAVKAGS